jgi:hypothetical protein
MGVMKQIVIELENASELIKYMEHRITMLEREIRVIRHKATPEDFRELYKYHEAIKKKNFEQQLRENLSAVFPGLDKDEGEE